MDADNHKSSPLALATSWTALLMGLVCLGFLAWYIPVDRRKYALIFLDFKMELPASTALMLSVPDTAVRVAAGLLAIGLVAVQGVSRSKLAAAVFHMLIVVLCCVAFVAYRETLYQPMMELIRGISSQPGGG